MNAIASTAPRATAGPKSIATRRCSTVSAAAANAVDSAAPATSICPVAPPAARAIGYSGKNASRAPSP
jgi:hypothetical protein